METRDTKWDYISIIYPGVKTTRNVLKIHLPTTCGAILDDGQKKRNSMMNKLLFLARYKGIAGKSTSHLSGTARELQEIITAEDTDTRVADCEDLFFYEQIILEKTCLALLFVKEKKLLLKPKA